MQKNFNLYKNYFVIFVVNALVMLLELVAARVLAPYFGTTQDIWTAIIGIILLSGSIGNVLGGKYATKENIERNVLRLFAITTLIIPFISDIVLSFSTLTGNLRIGAVISSIILFFIPSALSGMLTPIILTKTTSAMSELSKSSGRYYAIMTIGGLVGTFLGGFWIIPMFRINTVLFAIATCSFILCILYEKKNMLKAGYAVVSVVPIIASFVYEPMNMNEYRIYETNSEYNYIAVYEYKTEEGELVRGIDFGQDPGMQSVTYVDGDKKFQTTVAYHNMMFDMVKTYGDGADVLVLGGGGYCFPKLFLSGVKNGTIDVVEIDKEVTRVAYEYFYMNEAEEAFASNGNTITSYNEDGRVYLNDADKTYDVIINDTFASGGIPARVMTTKETMQLAKKHLNDDGLYLINVIGSIDGSYSEFLKAEYKTACEVFDCVYLIPSHHVLSSTERSNYIMICKNYQSVPEDAIYPEVTDDTVVLTDDYAPIELLYKRP